MKEIKTLARLKRNDFQTKVGTEQTGQKKETTRPGKQLQEGHCVLTGANVWRWLETPKKNEQTGRDE